MSITLRQPSPGKLAAADLTYAEIGGTRDLLPSGYRHVEREQRLGVGPHVFERVADAVLTWQMHRGAGLQVWTATPRATAGSDVACRLGGRRMGLVATCRVVYVMDEPARRGFAYGTLRWHPEIGEEAFVVTLDQEGQVWVRIRAFSRPAGSLSRAAGPLGRRVQDRITERYISALERVAASGGEASSS